MKALRLFLTHFREETFVLPATSSRHNEIELQFTGFQAFGKVNLLPS